MMQGQIKHSFRRHIGNAPYTSRVSEQPDGTYKATTNFNGKEIVGEGANSRTATDRLREAFNLAAFQTAIPTR